MKTSPGGATDSPLLQIPDSNSPLGWIPHARFAQDAKTPRQARNGIRSSPLAPLAPFASLRLCVSQSGPPRDSWFHPSPLTSEKVHHRHETYPNGIPPTAPFASSRLRVSLLCGGMKSLAKNEEQASPDVFACPPSPKLIFTPRRRARRGWNPMRIPDLFKCRWRRQRLGQTTPAATECIWPLVAFTRTQGGQNQNAKDDMKALHRSAPF
jgi:hypothetical protein